MDEKINILNALLIQDIVPNIFISGDRLDTRLVWTVSIDYDEYPIMAQDGKLENALSKAITAFYLQKSLSRLGI